MRKANTFYMLKGNRDIIIVEKKNAGLIKRTTLIVSVVSEGCPLE